MYYTYKISTLVTCIMSSMPSGTQQERPTGGRIARAAGTIMAAFVFSNLVGLLAKTLTARAFGTGIESNAFFAANRFSEILFNLVAGGALGSAFIPVFTGLLVEKQKERAWELASSVSNIVAAVLIVFSLLTILFSKQIVRMILAPGFAGEEVKLTAQLLQIQVISSVIFGLSGLVMGILNSHNHFLLPAIAPAMYQLGWIFGIYFLAPGIGIFGLAWGVVAGSVLHLLIQIPILMKLPDRFYKFQLGLHIPEVREVARLMAPRVLGVAVVQLNFLVNTILASFQREGSITALGLAFPLMIMPEAAIAQSIAIASLPTFAGQVAKNQIGEMRSTLSGTLRSVIMLSLPATIGLVILRRPLISLLYRGQAFGENSTNLVAWALLWYALGLVGHSIVEIISRAFYALHDTKTPVYVGIGAMSLNLGFSFLFTFLFSRAGWLPLGGLALANSAATAVESVILTLLIRKRLNGLEGRSILISSVKSVISAAAMGGIVYSIYNTFSNISLGMNTAISVLSGAISYGIILLILRTKEAMEIKRWLINKMGLTTK